MRFLGKSRKKVVVPLILTMILGSTGAAFAATSETATIPMYITVPATKIDVSVTEKITMTGTGNSTALTINNLDITNNGTYGVVNIDSIELTPTSDWTLKSNIVDFSVLPADSKAFSMVADGTWDFTDGAYTSAGEVQPQATDTTTLSGQTGAAITPVEDQKIADVVVTLSLSRGGSVAEQKLTLNVTAEGHKLGTHIFDGIVEGGLYKDGTLVQEMTYIPCIVEVSEPGTYEFKVTPNTNPINAQWYNGTETTQELTITEEDFQSDNKDIVIILPNTGVIIEKKC